MQQKISGEFSTRRAAELAVERLVQEHGIDRTLVEVRARGDANSVGTKLAGADVESGHRGERAGAAKLNDVIEVTVECADANARVIEAAMRDAGAAKVVD